MRIQRLIPAGDESSRRACSGGIDWRARRNAQIG